MFHPSCLYSIHVRCHLKCMVYFAIVYIGMCTISCCKTGNNHNKSYLCLSDVSTVLYMYIGATCTLSARNCATCLRMR